MEWAGVGVGEEALMEILKLLGVCLRIGAVVFGGGMVMIPLMETDVVDNNQWLTKQEFVDAVALGQMTPGPLLVTATFVGYKVGQGTGIPLGGPLVATLATVAIFVPSFIMTIIASKRLAKLQENPWVQHFLWGVRASVVGLIIGAAYSIAQASIGSWYGLPFLVASLVLLLATKVDAGLIVVACGAAGFLVFGVAGVGG